MTEDLKTKIAGEICFTDQIDEAGYDDLAQAALQAIHDAGYVVVPREPTETMMMAGSVAGKVVSTDEAGRRITRYPAVNAVAAHYRAMIQASQPNTKEQG